MTEELQSSLARELEAAVDSGDDKRLNRAHSNILLALMDCQRKTAERVKELRIEADRKQHRLQGAKLLWDVLKIAAASGGGAIILKFISAGGVVQ